MPINELLLTEFDEEIKKTRTMLERVPEDKKDFAPHPKSMPLNKLAPHVAQLAGFGLTILQLPNLISRKPSFHPCLLIPRRNWSRPSMKAQPKLAPR
jgi:hypothetical protein